VTATNSVILAINCNATAALAAPGSDRRRALLVLLTTKAEPEVLALLRVGGWRKATALTPGLVKDALARRFGNIEAFRLLLVTQTKTAWFKSG